MENKTETRELKIPSDLSASSISDARRELNAFAKFNDDLTRYYCLRCASQNMGEALIICALHSNVYLQLSIDYGPDEWSFETMMYKDDVFYEYKVHTKGA